MGKDINPKDHVSALERRKFRNSINDNSSVAICNEDSFALNVSREFIQDKSGNPLFKSIHIFGDIADIDVGTGPADVTTNLISAPYFFPTVAAQLSFVSSSILDDVGNLGAEGITFEGLDANFDEITESKALDGTTSGLTTQSFIRLNNYFATTALGNEFNLGNITATHGTDILATIPIGLGQANNAIFTIPNGFNGLLYRWHSETHRTIGASAAVKEAVTTLFIREEGQLWRGIQISGQRSDSGKFNSDDNFFRTLPPKTDIRVQAQALNNNSAVATGFEILLEKII